MARREAEDGYRRSPPPSEARRHPYEAHANRGTKNYSTFAAKIAHRWKRPAGSTNCGGGTATDERVGSDAYHHPVHRASVDEASESCPTWARARHIRSSASASGRDVFGRRCDAAGHRLRALGLPQFSKIFLLWFACSSLFASSCSVAGQRQQDSSSTRPPEQQYAALYGCPNCVIPHDAIRQYTLNEIKDTILSRLGFSQVPNITNRLPTAENMLISKFMSEVYRPDGQHVRHKPYLHEVQSDASQHDEEDDERLRNTHMVAVAKACSTESYCKKYKTHYPLTFVFEPKTTKTKLLSAKLSFYQKQLSTSKNSDIDMRTNITIYKLITRPGGSYHYTSLLTTEEKLSPLGRWIEIDIKEHLEKNFKENHSPNLSLVIIASHPNYEIVSKLVTEINDEEEPLYPFLQIRTEEQRSKRPKRSNHMDCKDGDKYTRCCRYPLTVDFEAFQWNFIIAPRKYEAYYCAGECGPLSNQKYPHTHLALMVPPNSTHYPITACCGARKMESISMIYYDQDNNIHYGLLPGMVVHRCGCA